MGVGEAVAVAIAYPGETNGIQLQTSAVKGRTINNNTNAIRCIEIVTRIMVTSSISQFHVAAASSIAPNDKVFNVRFGVRSSAMRRARIVLRGRPVCRAALQQFMGPVGFEPETKWL